MFNPLTTLKRFKSRIGKPIRPIIELQKGGSIVNILTTTIQTENVIVDTYKTEAWEVHPEDVSSAIYVDGIFKGMGFFAGEEGQVLKLKLDKSENENNLVKVLYDTDAQQYSFYATYQMVAKKLVLKVQKDVVLQDSKGGTVTASYKGIFGRLLDASLYERGSALKPSMMQVMIYAAMALIMGFLAGMSYGR